MTPDIQETRTSYIQPSKPRDPLVSDQGFFLSEPGVIFASKLPHRTLILVAPWGRMHRAFARLWIAGTEYYADVVTGSLYGLDGLSATRSRLSVRAS